MTTRCRDEFDAGRLWAEGVLKDLAGMHPAYIAGAVHAICTSAGVNKMIAERTAIIMLTAYTPNEEKANRISEVEEAVYAALGRT